MSRALPLVLCWTALLLSSCANKPTYDLDLNAPADFSESGYSIETIVMPFDDEMPERDVVTRHEMNFRSDQYGIWITFEDFDDKVIKMFSIEDKIARKAFAHLNATGAAERGTDPRGEVLAGTEIRFDEDGMAHGVIITRLHPVGERNWIDGEPITVKLSFANIEQREP